jgi:hypothetical protein
MTQREIMTEASRRVKEFEKNNPLTIEEMLKMDLAGYKEHLMITFIKEVVSEKKA